MICSNFWSIVSVVDVWLASNSIWSQKFGLFQTSWTEIWVPHALYSVIVFVARYLSLVCRRCLDHYMDNYCNEVST